MCTWLSVCREGWNIFEDHCYKFVNDQQMTHSSARGFCRSQGGHLVHINTKTEDDYIKGYLINFYPNSTTWRTGGKEENGKFVWHFGGGKASEPMTYTSWAPNMPGRYTTQILHKFEGTPPRFVWKSTWAGSNTGNSYQYPFICEAETSSKKFNVAVWLFTSAYI